MTQQQTPTTQQVTTMPVMPAMLPYEISKAILESSGALASIQSVTQGTLSGIDTQDERTDLVTQVRDYFEGGAINVGGLLVGVLFVVAGMYLLFLEFKESPKNQNMKRVVRDVSARKKASERTKAQTVKARKVEARKRRAAYDSD